LIRYWINKQIKELTEKKRKLFEEARRIDSFKSKAGVKIKINQS
jgi:hypothetical protein